MWLIWEVSLLGDEMTELAIIARYYLHILGVNRIKELIEKNTSTYEDKRKFLILTIAYSLQHLAIEDELNKFYVNSLRYVLYLKKDIIPMILSSKESINRYKERILVRIW